MKIAVLLLALCGAACGPTARSGPDWKVFTHPRGSFTLEHPASWTVQNDSQWSSISSPPDVDAVLMVSAFLRPRETVKTFADQRMAVQREIYTPLADPRDISTPHWVAVVEQAKGHEAGETFDTVRFSFCVARSENGPLFVSLTGYVAEKDFPRVSATFEKICHSIRFGSRD